MRRVVQYVVVLFVFFILVKYIDQANQYMNILAATTYTYGPFKALVQTVGFLIFGLFLGSLNLIGEWQKDGFWKVDKAKLLVLGLPLFIIPVMVSITHFGIVWPQIILNIVVYLLAHNNMYNFIVIFLGYVLLSSFTKEKGLNW